MSTPSYQQGEKHRVRTQVLAKAVRSLTEDRHKATIVRLDELAEVVDHAKAQLRRWMEPRAEALIDHEVERWSALYESRISSKEPSDLKVLYLSGPEPLNDLGVLMQSGINPHNVWAIESNKHNFEQALKQLRESCIPLKLHLGDLSDFFETYNRAFDIVYYDACGAFPVAKPSTLEPILKLLAAQRLEPLSVLITTFTGPPEDCDDYTQILSKFFSFRYRDLPKFVFEAGLDPELFQHGEHTEQGGQFHVFVSSNTERLYSEFLTRFLIDLSRSWIPTCRALSNKSLFASLLKPHKESEDVLRAAKRFPDDDTPLDRLFEETGDIVLNPSGYPLLSFFESLKRNSPRNPLVSQLGNFKICGSESGKLIGFASIIDHVIEGHWKCLSEPLLDALRYSWFDSKVPLFCDPPMPHLLINSILGVYGRPYHPNPRMSSRLAYTAKTRRMFTDQLLFDQCEYYYDWFPTIHLAKRRFESIPFQIVARSMLDRIGRHDFHSDTHPFRASSLVGLGKAPVASWYDFAPAWRLPHLRQQRRKLVAAGQIRGSNEVSVAENAGSDLRLSGKRRKQARS